MASEEQLDHIAEVFSELSGLLNKGLVHRPEWGELNFEQLRPELEIASRNLKSLHAQDLSIVPQENARQLVQHSTQLKDALSHIDAFTLTGQENPTGRRDKLVEDARAPLQQFNGISIGLIPYLSLQGEGADEFLTRQQSKWKEAERNIDGQIQQIEQKAKDIDQALESARDTSSASGLANQAALFSKLADEFGDNAEKWLWSTILLAVLAIGFTIKSEWLLDSSQISLYAFSKLSILLILISGVLWCGRQYSARKNLETVARHREVGLKTLEQFREATTDPATRDAVLLEITRAVFQNVPTGLVPNRESGSEHGTHIVEISKFLKE